MKQQKSDKLSAAAERERCAKVAQKIAYELADGEGELYVARKIVDAIRALEDRNR